MVGSRGLKTVHVVAGLGAAIVLVALAAIAYQGYRNDWGPMANLSPVATRLRELTRTHQRPLSTASPDLLESAAAESLQQLRDGGAETDDHLGFVSMPSFPPWYAVSIRLPKGAVVAYGRIVSIRPDDRLRHLGFSQAQTFTTPKAVYLRMIDRLDVAVAGWPGEGRGHCYDGVEVAFERARDGLATSGVGNASCIRHYAEVRRIIEGPLVGVVPKPGG